MKVLKSLVMAVLVVLTCFVVRAEAATVAVIPLINKATFATAEAEKVPNQIFMNQALAVLKTKTGFMLVDNDRLRFAVKENIDPYKLPTKEQMATVCKKGNVDIVFAMELTNYDYTVNEQASSRVVVMNVRAKLVSYNRLTGKYIVKNCVDDSQMDETFTSRWNVVQEAWTRMVAQEMSRITRVKK